jgi:hypothetical protein
MLSKKCFYMKQMTLFKYFSVAAFLLVWLTGSYAQTTTTTSSSTTTENKEEKKLIQFSGLLLTDDGTGMTPVPYATIYIPSKKRGTYSDYRGFFSIVVEKGDKVQFTYVGLESRTITVPDTLTQERYSVVQFLPQDTILLPEFVIFAWPSKEHFKIEFLKMDVTPELQRIAAKNIANEYLAEARKNEDIVPFSGKEGANYYLRQQSREFTYIGQTPPMNIFSPIAWAQFFKDWKDGKFKKKE